MPRSEHDDSPTRKPWSPIVAGEQLRRCRALLDEIVESVAAFAPTQPSLSKGASGHALLLAYYSMAFGREELGAPTTSFLEMSVEMITRAPFGASLYNGFIGVAWALEHLTESPDDYANQEEDPHAVIEESLRVLLRDEPWHNEGLNYDLIGGLVGLAVYCLERLPRPVAVENLETIVERLEQCAEPCDGGLTWRTPAFLLPTQHRKLASNGGYNLGLAHGVSGIISLLGKLVAVRVGADRARPLLDGAVRWLLARRIFGTDASFGAWFDRADEPRPARTAWCYGDPSVACGLLTAARAIGEPTWERTAVDLMKAAASRPLDRCGVVDAGLCHGSFGIAHLFNRFFHATGVTLFADIARSWINDGLARRRPGKGILGYLAYDPSTLRWEADRGFLTGITGIGLALTAACSSLEPQWDRILLCDLPR